MSQFVKAGRYIINMSNVAYIEEVVPEGQPRSFFQIVFVGNNSDIADLTLESGAAEKFREFLEEVSDEGVSLPEVRYALRCRQ